MGEESIWKMRNEEGDVEDLVEMLISSANVVECLEDAWVGQVGLVVGLMFT